MMALFSVICPVYNSAGFISRTLESVFSQVSSNFELIVVDDGSDDNSVEVVRNLSLKFAQKEVDVRLIEIPHSGPGRARNIGVQAAHNEWIAFIDSDDTWEKDKLDCVEQEISKNPDVNFFCNAEYHVNDAGEKRYVDYSRHALSEKPLKFQLYNRNLFSTSAVVVRKAILDEFGLFDEKMMNAQDYELWLRLAPALKVKFIRKSLGHYCQRIGNISSSNDIKKFKNLYLIIWRYRDYVNLFYFCKKVLSLTAKFALAFGKFERERV